MCFLRNQQVDLRFDTQSEELVMGTKGLDASVPEIMKADLAYWPDQQTVTGTFNQEVSWSASQTFRLFFYCELFM